MQLQGRRPRKWDRGQKVWMRGPTTQNFDLLMWVQDWEYSEEREGWEYKLQNKDGKLWETWVPEEDLKNAERKREV